MNSARPPSVVNAEAADELLAGHRLPDAGLGQEQRKLEQPNWEQAQEQAPPLLPDAGANSRGTAGEAPGSAISTPLSPASPRPAQPRPSPQAASFTSGPSPLAAAAAVPPLVAPLPGAALPLQQLVMLPLGTHTLLPAALEEPMLKQPAAAAGLDSSGPGSPFAPVTPRHPAPPAGTAPLPAHSQAAALHMPGCVERC